MRRGRPLVGFGPYAHDPAVVSLRTRIAELGVSQVQLALWAELYPVTLSRLVNGRKRLDGAVELRLHRILDIEQRAQEAAEAVRRREFAREGGGAALRDVSRPRLGAAS